MNDRVLKIFLADDHAIVREGAAALINAQPDMEVIGQAANGLDALALVATSQPDLVIIDIAMPGENGIIITEHLRQTFPAMLVLALTRYSEASYVRKIMHAGARGYVLKQATASELITAIRTLALGGTYFDVAITKYLARSTDTANQQITPTHRQELSDREINVAQLLAYGYSNKEIAAQLEVSVKSVETYKSRAMEKLGLYSRAALVRHALEHGWFEQ